MINIWKKRIHITYHMIQIAQLKMPSLQKLKISRLYSIHLLFWINIRNSTSSSSNPPRLSLVFYSNIQPQKLHSSYQKSLGQHKNNIKSVNLIRLKLIRGIKETDQNSDANESFQKNAEYEKYMNITYDTDHFTKTAACKFCPINRIKKHQTRTIHSIITCRIGLQQMFCLLLDFLVTTSPRLLSKYRNFKFNGSWRSINISAKRGYKRNDLSCWKWSWGNFEKFKFFPKITS